MFNNLGIGIHASAALTEDDIYLRDLRGLQLSAGDVVTILTQDLPLTSRAGYPASEFSGDAFLATGYGQRLSA